MRKLIYTLCLMPCALSAAPLTGFYQTIDDETNSPKSIVRLYECGDELCGRIVALYDEAGVADTKSQKIADEVKGKPKMVGLDIIWGMEWDDDDAEYEDGKIMDPKKGSVYSAEIWADEKDATKLRVRGKIGPFGRTQTWNVMNVSDLPMDLQKLDTKNWVQKIIK